MALGVPCCVVDLAAPVFFPDGVDFGRVMLKVRFHNLELIVEGWKIVNSSFRFAAFVYLDDDIGVLDYITKFSIFEFDKFSSGGALVHGSMSQSL